MNRIASILGALVISTPAISQSDPKMNPLDYALKVEYSVPTISWIPQQWNGTWFIIDKVRWIIMTAAHVIPAVLPWLKEGILTVEWEPAELVCLDGEHDLAILKTKNLPSSKKTPKITNYTPKIGDSYISTLENDKWMAFEIQHNQSGEFLQIPMTLTSQWTIISVSNAVKMKINGEKESTNTEILITDKPSKPWFSWGPALDSKWNLVWVQIRVDTSFGVLSSVTNVRRLLKEDSCKIK